MYDGQVRVYRDGVKVAESAPIFLPTTTGPTWIGQSASGGRWTGGIDDVAVYGYALSDAQVLAQTRNRSGER
jgi:hypothetical protein